MHKILNRIGKYGYICLIPDLMGKSDAVNFS